MAEVAVNTGRSVRFIGLGVDMGVVVLGGSHFSGSCWGIVAGAGPSGWYDMNMSGAGWGAGSGA